MSAPTENETWVIEAGADVIRKKSHGGLDVLDPKEKLLYCFWVADYGMRNAGDLDAASDVCYAFQEEGASLAKSLSLEFTRETFEFPKEVFQREYFDRFDRVCDEIRRA